jgi:Toprim domain
MNGARLDIIRTSLAARAAEVTLALLGEPNSRSGRRELRFGRKGSISVMVAGPKAGSWYDHEAGVGGDLLSLIQRERAGTFQGAVAYAEKFIGHVPLDLAQASLSPAKGQPFDNAADCARNGRIALDLWREAGPIAGTIAASYLELRALVLPARIDGAVLRFHPHCPCGQKIRHPCVIALLRDIHTNAPRAIQRTALSSASSKIGRMTLGPKAGSAIKLSADADVTHHLAIGEGLETTLAGMLLGYRPAWAVGDAGELSRFPVLSGIESLTILVDHDKSGAGQRAAIECSRRWTEAGREVFRVFPERCGDDINDVVRRSLP